MATNNAANFGTGTAGQVLTSNGAGVAPTFQAGGSGTVTSVSGTSNQVSVATGTTTPVISLVGPYTPATYTAHGVLIGEGTSSIVALAAGTAGQALLSGGASADPAYTTATFPTTAGSSGNVLTSDGTNWTSAAAGGGVILTATHTLTNSEIKNLHATPIQIIAAPGANKIIIITSYAIRFIYGGTNAFTAAAGQAIAVYYNNNTTVTVTSTNYVPNAMVTSTANKFVAGVAIAAGLSNEPAGVLDNVNIAVWNPSATEIGGNAANNNTMSLTFTYLIAST